MESARGPEDSEIVTIDGPAGAGKSTVSRMLARSLKFFYLDTGAMYRAVALQAKKEGVPLNDEAALEDLCRRIEITFRDGEEGQRVICQGEDVTEKIRDPEIGGMASAVSLVKAVRESMVRLQREIGSRGGIVAEGRDTGTVVFPGAKYKFFLQADPRERARRRYREFAARGLAVSLEKIEREVRDRDEQDSSRRLAPLRPAEDARIIDSTGLLPEEVVKRIGRIIRETRDAEVR